MATFEFEGIPGIGMEVTEFASRVREPGALFAAEPQTIIRVGSPWQVEADWEVVGPLGWLFGPPWIPGNYRIEAYLESIGTAAEHNLGAVLVPMAGLGPHGGPAFPIAVPGAGPGSVATPGPYKLVVTLTAENAAGFRFPMAGYMEGPILQFYAIP
jgi:hypothetical protein